MSPQYDCRVTWKVPPELRALQSDWPAATFSFESEVTLKELLGQLKQDISRKFDRCEEFSTNGISGFMSKLTKQINVRRTPSAQAEMNTFWIIRFHTTISAADSTINLDSGIWLRFSELSDIILTPGQVKVRVELKFEECQREDYYRQDTSMENHVYSRRPRATHFLIGTVQNWQTTKEAIQLLETKKEEKPVDRKNVILARFEEINGFRIGADFRMLNTWRFVKPDNKSYFKRIGDIEGGIVCDLAFLDENKVDLSTTYQLNGNNVDFEELGKRVDKELRKLDKNRVRDDKKELEVPMLPELTLHRFPAAQLRDPNNVPRDGVNVLAVVRVVYMVPKMELSHHKKRVPQNCYFDDIDKNKTFLDMDNVLFEGIPQPHQRLDPSFHHVKTKRVCGSWIHEKRETSARCTESTGCAHRFASTLRMRLARRISLRCTLNATFARRMLVMSTTRMESDEQMSRLWKGRF